MQMNVSKQVDLPQRWTYLDGKKGSVLTDAEEYAAWTLPYVFPRNNLNQGELQLSHDSIGAQAVNHLSNKVVSILFPAQRMFFRLMVEQELRDKAEQAVALNGAPSLEAAQQEVAKAMADVETQLASAEKRVQDYMDMVTYRPQAVNAAKLLIITGNALEYHPKDRPVQIYTLRDYCVLRDLSGEVIEIMTKENKSFETFKPEIQAKLRDKELARTVGSNKTYEDSSDIAIYTRIRLEDDGKYHVTQSADNIPLDTTDAFYTKSKLPWIPLTWNLIRGEDYGRGLVADYSGAFHAVNTLTGSLLNIAAVMGDIKFLVNPTSLVDVGEMNRSPAGSFHPGKKDDISAVTVEKLADAQFIATIIERYERQIAQAFLLNSQLTRNAERVTAEEIQMQANELETSNGGIYSRLAATWQQQLANVLLDQTGFVGLGEGFVPKIVTGMDSLSRAGELDNIRLFLADIAMLNGIPEDFRVYVDKPAFAKLVGANRQVDYQKFIKSNEQVAQEQQAAVQQQEQLMQKQGQVEATTAASKEAMKG